MEWKLSDLNQIIMLNCSFWEKFLWMLKFSQSLNVDLNEETMLKFVLYFMLYLNLISLIKTVQNEDFRQKL